MKSNQFLIENANPKLLKYIKNSKGLNIVSNYAVFVWDDITLENLLRNGANSGGNIDRVETPTDDSYGMGIVNLSTGDVCVGAIDTDYTVYWASSAKTPTVFFKQVNERKIKNLLSELSELANLYELYNETDEGDDGSDSDNIMNTLNDKYDLRIDLDTDGKSPTELKKYFEEQVKELPNKIAELEKIYNQHMDQARALLHLDRQKSKSIRNEGNKFNPSRHKETLDSLKEILKKEKKLFEPKTDDGEVEDSKTLDDIEDRIDEIIHDMDNDFPGLHITNKWMFDPT